MALTKNIDTSQTCPRCHCIPHPAFFPRTSWPRRAQTVRLQWLSQPWPPLWISHSRVTGPYIQLEPCFITWTGPWILGRTRRWSLSPSRKVLIKTSHLPLYAHGSNRLWSYAMSSLTKRPSHYIRLKPMMSGPLLLPRPSSLSLLGSNFVSLPLEVTQCLHTVLSEGCCLG